jgi:hypothetical protein
VPSLGGGPWRPGGRNLECGGILTGVINRITRSFYNAEENRGTTIGFSGEIIAILAAVMQRWKDKWSVELIESMQADKGVILLTIVSPFWFYCNRSPYRYWLRK